MSVATIVRIRSILIHHGMGAAVDAFRFAAGPLAQPRDFCALILNKNARVR